MFIKSNERQIHKRKHHKKTKNKKKTNQVSNVYVRLDKLKLENASFFGFLGWFWAALLDFIAFDPPVITIWQKHKHKHKTNNIGYN